MAFNIPQYMNGSSGGGGGTKERPADDTHFGRCFQILDMGTQPNRRYGPKRKLRLVFELSTKDSDGNRFVVNLEENMVVSPKSNIGKAVGAWRGRPLTDDECAGAGFDITKVLGAAGMFTVFNRQDGDKTYTNIVNFAKVPTGMEVDELEQPTAVFDMSNPDMAVFASLPSFVQARIASSPEGVALGLKAADANNDAVDAAEVVPATAPAEAAEAPADDCPF